MPSNIFATTGTNVSVVFIDKNSKTDHITLIDASKLGTTVKEGKNQKTLLSAVEEDKIISAFSSEIGIDHFSVVLDKTQVISKDYSFSAGQYFEIRSSLVALSTTEFNQKVNTILDDMKELFKTSRDLEKNLLKKIEDLTNE